MTSKGCLKESSERTRKKDLAQCLAHLRGFPGGTTGKNLPANVGDMVRSLGQEDPLEKGMATHSMTFAWRIHGQSRLTGYSPRSHRESGPTEWLSTLH